MSMNSLESGPLQGITIQISVEREASLRAALAKLLEHLDLGDRYAATALLRHEFEGSSIGARLRDALLGLERAPTLAGISLADRDVAIRKATVSLGAPDRAESEALSRGGRVVFAWASGEVLAFAEIEDAPPEARWRDVTDEVLDELDAEPDPQPPEGRAPAEDLAEDLEALVEGRPLAPVAVAEASCGDARELTMCSLCGGGMTPGEPVAMWPTDSQHPAHTRCQGEEIARRSARGLYGSVEEMRRELAMRGRPVGEVWEVRELERRILDARRETDEIDWASYETKTAQRKQGRECLVCGLSITKGQDYKQASRGRKAHRACVVQEEAQRERAAIQAEQPDVQPA